MSRRSYSDTAVKTELTALLNASGLTAQVDALVGFPNFATGPFVVTLERETTREEKILVESFIGTTVTISQRGFGGTTPQDHSIGSTFEHTWSGKDADEANDHVNKTTSIHGLGPSDGAIVGTTKTQTFTHKTIDCDDNTLLNIPTTASPDLVALIDAETDAREAAVAAEVVARDAAIDAEASNREAADTALSAAITAAVAAAVPVGAVQMYGGAAAPAGFLLCQGQAVSRVTYAALFAVLSTTYGPGDGTTTFNVPDLGKRSPVGVGTGYLLGQQGGAALSTIETTNLPSHIHGITHGHLDSFAVSSGGSHTHGSDAKTVQSDLLDTPQFEAGIGTQDRSFHDATISAGGSHTHSLSGGVTTSTANSTATGDGSPLDTQDAYTTVNFIIKAL